MLVSRMDLELAKKTVKKAPQLSQAIFIDFYVKFDITVLQFDFRIWSRIANYFWISHWDECGNNRLQRRGN